MTRHFLTLRDCSGDELERIVARAIELKQARAEGRQHALLQHRTLALIFDKSSTRTRVSFEAGMTQLGGAAMFLSPNDLQLGRGEPI
ncbi:MAG: ornithine carbamoyltransferase, partial [Acidiferrobacteraceae bacterium]